MTYLDFLPGDMWITRDQCTLLLVSYAVDERYVHTTFFIMHYPGPIKWDMKRFFTIDYELPIPDPESHHVSGRIIRDGVEVWYHT